MRLSTTYGFDQRDPKLEELKINLIVTLERARPEYQVISRMWH